MSTVIGNYGTNKQWAMVGVVLYSKNHVQTNEVTDFCMLKLKTLWVKEVTDFMNIRLPSLKG